MTPPQEPILARAAPAVADGGGGAWLLGAALAAVMLVSLFTYGVSTWYRRASSPAAAFDPPCLNDTLDDSKGSEHDGRW